MKEVKAYAVCTAAGTRKNPGAAQAAILQALSDGRLHPVRDLKETTGLSPAKFDRAFESLWRGRKISADNAQLENEAAVKWWEEAAGISRSEGLVKIGRNWYVTAELRRSNPAEAAEKGFEMFHGFPSTQEVTIKKQRHFHEHLSGAGRLRALVVAGIDRKEHTIRGFRGALLAFNEAKNQLFVEGGDQALDLRPFGIREPHELETLGKVTAIDYHTTKTHLGDEGGKATYAHRFRTTNENGKHVTVTIARYPDLIYRVLDEQLEFSGGSYIIRAEGIDL